MKIIIDIPDKIYNDFKVHISKLIETIVFSRSELEDIKKQLIFDDNNANKSLKYF